MSEQKISPKLAMIIAKFKLRMSDEDAPLLDKIIEFTYSEGSINGRSELYNTPIKQEINERS